MSAIAPVHCEIAFARGNVTAAAMEVVVDDRQYVGQEWKDFVRICIAEVRVLDGGRIMVYQRGERVELNPGRAPLRLVGREGSPIRPAKRYALDLDDYQM